PEKTRHVRHSSMFRDRLISALSQRLTPRGTLRRKELAYALGVHGDTFNRWMRGEGSPTSEMTAALVRFFWSAGDRSFASELFDIDVLPIMPATVRPETPPHIAEAVAALDQAKQRLLESAA